MDQEQELLGLGKDLDVHSMRQEAEAGQGDRPG